MVKRRPPGRPLGEVSQAILDELQNESLTVRQLALRLRCSVPVVDDTCRRLRQAGRIELVDLIRVEGANRRVGQYKASVETNAAPHPSMIVFGVSHGR